MRNAENGVVYGECPKILISTAKNNNEWKKVWNKLKLFKALVV